MSLTGNNLLSYTGASCSLHLTHILQCDSWMRGTGILWLFLDPRRNEKVTSSSKGKRRVHGAKVQYRWDPNPVVHCGFLILRLIMGKNYNKVVSFLVQNRDCKFSWGQALAWKILPLSKKSHRIALDHFITLPDRRYDIRDDNLPIIK